MTDSDVRATTEKAMLAALEYETKVRDVYAGAVSKATNATAKKVFEVLAEEEQGHVDYLESKLATFREKGTLEPGKLATAIPSPRAIEAGVKKLARKLQGKPTEVEVELLRKALAVEEETSDFYRRMVGELPPAGQDFFRAFVAIEDGHVAVVQAEIDAVTGNGFWFDFQEFDLEVE